MQHLVYLHGFLSSPQSQKAQQTLRYANKHFPSLNVHIPQLHGDINKAVKTIDALVSTLPISQTCFIGSSMGGFLSTYCVEKYGAAISCVDSFKPKAVLVNPAIAPFDLLTDYLGKQTNPYTNEVFYITAKHIAKLKQLYAAQLRQAHNYRVLLQTDDEILDYRLAEQKYANAEIITEQGGNHSFVDYDAHLPSIFKFLYAG